MLPTIVPVTEVKRNAAQVLDQLRQDRNPVLITEHGRGAAVLLDLASYDELLRRADILDRITQLQPEITKTFTAMWGDIARMMQAAQAEGFKNLPKPGATSSMGRPSSGS